MKDEKNILKRIAFSFLSLVVLIIISFIINKIQ